MTEETETIDEIREWRRSRRSAGHSSESDLLALGRLVEKRWLEDEARAKRKRDMAEGTAAIQRLDYSKPPPGYLVHDLNDDGWWWRVDEPEDGCLSPHETEGEALAAAWAHYKAHNDPSGLRVSYVLTVGWIVMVEEPKRLHIHTEVSAASAASARAAAWAWYDRRLALVGRLKVDGWPTDAVVKVIAVRQVRRPGENDAAYSDRVGARADCWPRCLTWSDDQVAEVERWLADSTAEMPEVLRG